LEDFIIKVIINGEICNLEKIIILSDLLQSQGYDVKRVAVEINKIIIPKNQYISTIINDGDKIEIVQFVGGG